jgi:hypothetical protein
MVCFRGNTSSLGCKTDPVPSHLSFYPSTSKKPGTVHCKQTMNAGMNEELWLNEDAEVGVRGK